MTRINPIFPPLKRDWTPGSRQIGLFLRTPTGAVIKSSWNNVSLTQYESAIALLKAINQARAPAADASTDEILDVFAGDDPPWPQGGAKKKARKKR